MKQVFTPKAKETYASQQKALREKAEAIEKRLNMPSNPAPTLRPKGIVQSKSHEKVRNNLRQQRVDIFKELDVMRKEKQQRINASISKGKTI
ncbi:MAG: hypothetical protein COA84_12115 [Robiginitomaculum sp.]|nr:MAG: hypothetical protein COA84_12115 [Robiginitomaculum sp.]